MLFDVSVARVVLPPGEHPVEQVRDAVICVHLGAPVTLVRSSGGRERRSRFEAGTVCVSPLGCDPPDRARIDASHEFLWLRIARERLERARSACGVVAGWRDEVHGPAPEIAHYTRALHDELAHRRAGTPLLIESLLVALEIHLVRAGTDASVTFGGTPSIRRAIEAIHGDLAADFTLETLAAQVGVSPHHFARSFRRATGLPPHRYIVRARVEHARRLIETTSLPLVEIAHRCGFCDQSHLARQFRRWLGIAPSSLRR